MVGVFEHLSVDTFREPQLVSSDCFKVLTSGSCNAKTVHEIGKNVAIFVIGGQF